MLSNLRRIGPILFFIIQPVILIAAIALSFFGLISGHLALLFFAAVSLEAISIAFFLRAKLNKTVNYLKEIGKDMMEIKEDSMELMRMKRELIYAGHQIKTLHMDLEALKKGSNLKLPGNGHHRRVHI